MGAMVSWSPIMAVRDLDSQSISPREETHTVWQVVNSTVPSGLWTSFQKSSMRSEIK